MWNTREARAPERPGTDLPTRCIPVYELPIECLDTRARIVEAEHRHRDPSSPRRILWYVLRLSTTRSVLGKCRKRSAWRNGHRAWWKKPKAEHLICAFDYFRRAENEPVLTEKDYTYEIHGDLPEHSAEI